MVPTIANIHKKFIAKNITIDFLLLVAFHVFESTNLYVKNAIMVCFCLCIRNLPIPKNYCSKTNALNCKEENFLFANYYHFHYYWCSNKSCVISC